MRVASIDLGSDSARMLIADVEDGVAHTVDEHAVVTRLGTGVDATRLLSREAVAATEAALAEHRARINAAGCARVGMVLTSAVRDAADGPSFAQRLARRDPDWRVRVLSGDEESWMVFRGATLDEQIDGPTLVVDIGGGSTELAVGTGERLLCRGSANVGTLRLGERHVAEAGYTVQVRQRMGRDIRAEIEREVPAWLRAETVAGLVTATTPTWRMALARFEAVGGYIERMSAEQLDAQLWSAAVEPSMLSALASDRVETITIGLAILIEAMGCFALPRLRLVPRDLLHGLAVSLAQEPTAARPLREIRRPRAGSRR